MESITGYSTVKEKYSNQLKNTFFVKLIVFYRNSLLDHRDTLIKKNYKRVIMNAWVYEIAII